MALTITLDQEQYSALVALAREGTKDAAGQVIQDLAVRLDQFLRPIERSNGIERDGVWVQWQEMDQPLPPTTRFPSVWPPELRAYIEHISRKVTRADVEAVLLQQARKPTSVLVTRDPGATCGWTELDKFFF